MANKTTLKTRLMVSVCLLAIVSTAAGKIIHVDADATGANEGTSWADAYNFLQDALADANSSEKPVEIQVVQGVYTPDSNSAVPDGTGNREATFQLINGVTLKGGYAGFGEPDPNAHDIELYETILSGDLNGDDANVADPIDLLGKPNRAENSYHVVTASATDETAILDGFTVTAGNANSPDYTNRNSKGGGMYNDRATPNITNCAFIRNAVRWSGGGMYNRASSPTITNCTFAGNSAGDRSGGHGGGMYNAPGSNPTLIHCTFRSNWAGQGGGMSAICAGPTIRNSTFSDNSANFGGGMQCKDCSNLMLTGCTFSGNSAHRGAGVEYINSSPMVTNCMFVANSAGNYGGAISIMNTSTPTLTNCTFTANSAPEGHALACDSYQQRPSQLSVVNSILWNGGNEVVNKDGSTITITYSDVQCSGRWPWPGLGNIRTDPLFADGTNDDFHLKSQAGRYDPNSQTWVKDDVTSPCIDAGNPMSPIGHELFPNGGIINMGTYGGTPEASKSYFGEPVCETIVAGDINGDRVVNFKDFAFLSLHWLTDNSP